MHKIYIIRNCTLIVFAALLTLSTMACASIKLTEAVKPDPAKISQITLLNRLDYDVVLAPVTIDRTAEKTDAKSEKALEIDCNKFADRLVETFKSTNVFKNIEKISPESESRKLQFKEARDKKASLLMDVAIKKARLYYVGKNGTAFPNVFVWLFLAFPSFWMPDLDYGVEIEVEVSFLDVGAESDFATQVCSYNCLISATGSLNFLQRGFSIAVVIMPPLFCAEDFSKIENLVLLDVQDKLIVQLAETTKEKLEIK